MCLQSSVSHTMPTTARRKQGQQKKAASTRAAKFVRMEMHEFRSGNPHVKSREQAIAIGLNLARKAGVRVRKRGGQ